MTVEEEKVGTESWVATRPTDGQPGTTRWLSDINLDGSLPLATNLRREVARHRRRQNRKSRQKATK